MLSCPALTVLFPILRQVTICQLVMQKKKTKNPKNSKNVQSAMSNLFLQNQKTFHSNSGLLWGDPGWLIQLCSTHTQYVHALRPFVQDFQTPGSNSRPVTVALTKLLDPRNSWTNSQTAVILSRRSFQAEKEDIVKKGRADYFLIVLGSLLQLGNV